MNAKDSEGLSGTELTVLGDTQFEIVMNWSQQSDLNVFLSSKWYKYLIGALDILTMKIKIQIKPSSL